ncbi:hypothetical protein [Micromonospora echinofusca]|uniref:Luciferase-like monooxygenase n=1 Tax=Micromonospora echinofusca TaxID=47858 RepID=A0ABS3VQM1_MICEH|nr:hypothetical protein [Micromonospora echinofusca]MBO4206771.1 hypothetical protein [Micromonospora echinofusca]
MTDRELHLNVNALPAGAHPAAWRSPGGNPRAWIDVGHYQRVAREAERGLLDAEFLADGLLLRGNVATGPSFALDHVVPELQRRGLFRKEYTGTTLRDHLGLARPASSYRAGWAR